jgi:hypothetical protein
LFLWGINLNGTPIPNIEEFNDAPIKTYRAMKTLAQYNKIIRVLTYWGDDKILATAEDDLADKMRSISQEKKV